MYRCHYYKLTRTSSGVQIAYIKALATSFGFNLGIKLTRSLFGPIVMISFSVNPGLIFYKDTKYIK